MKQKQITDKMRYRQSVINYAKKNGVSQTARVYHINRSYIYRWKKRFDGTIKSLANLPTTPKSHPNQHTQEEIKLIKNMFSKNKNTGLVVFWVKLKQRGYTRSISTFLYINILQLMNILDIVILKFMEKNQHIILINF